MAEFYKELKTLRESQNIDLAEIQNRTKIHHRFLEAFESGDFSVLPNTYVRLFLRAYVTEIGGDPQEALTQLEHYLGRSSDKSQSGVTKTETNLSHEKKAVDASPIKKPVSFQQYRANIIKGAALLAIWIFALIIIQKVVKNQDVQPVAMTGPFQNSDIEVINEDKILSDYVAASVDKEVLNIARPLSIKIISTELNAYVVKSDSLTSQDIFIPAGDNRSYTFENNIDLLFNHSHGLNVYINGDIIRKITPQNDPVRVSLTSNPMNLTVIHYTPIQ
ncbi:MAG: helix-turn-helix domain-containing protein [Fidelibacterota bacterium]